MTEAVAMCVTPFIAKCNVFAPLLAVFFVQNLIILKQGLMRNNPALTAFFTILCNVFLFAFGTYLNFGDIFLEDNIAFLSIRWIAAIALFIYGFTIFYNAKQVGKLRMYMLQDKPPFIAVALLIVLVTVLNPHAFVDAQKLHETYNYYNEIAILLTSIWLGFLSRLVERYESFMQKDFLWKMLDVLLGLTLWATALSILLPNSCICF